MSEEKSPTAVLAEITSMLRLLTTNQEKLLAEQGRMATALGEVGLILQNNTTALNHQGAACVRMWHELHLPVNEAPPAGPVN